MSQDNKNNLYNLLNQVYEELMQEAKEVKIKDEWLIAKMTGIKVYKEAFEQKINEA